MSTLRDKATTPELSDAWQVVFLVMTPDDPTLPEAVRGPDQMPGWVPRALILFFVGIASLWLLLKLFEDLSGFLVTLLIAFFFSFALEPAVNWLEHRGIRRGIGTLMMFVLAITLLSVFGWIVGSVLAEQTIDFVDRAPGLIDDAEEWLQDNVDESIELNRLRDQFLSDNGLGEQLTGLANNVVGLGATVVSLVFQLFTVALFTYYLTADGPKLRRSICSASNLHASGVYSVSGISQSKRPVGTYSRGPYSQASLRSSRGSPS